MTVKVSSQWERGWQAPIDELELYIHPLKEFGVRELYMCPVSGIADTSVLERQSLEEVIAENLDLVHVYVDESAPEELPNFIHPENCLYIMGKTSFSPYKTHARENDLAVKIPSITNNGGFWGHQAINLILYDRFLKGG